MLSYLIALFSLLAFVMIIVWVSHVVVAYLIDGCDEVLYDTLTIVECPILSLFVRVCSVTTR